MSVTDRVLHLSDLLNRRPRGVTFEEMKSLLRCSPATVHRVRREVEASFGTEIRYDRLAGVYRMESGDRIELPGFRFRPDELAALLGLSQWLESLGSGVLKERLDPIRLRLDEMLGASGIVVSNWDARIKLLPMHFRKVDPETLLAVADSTLRRKKLEVKYKGFRDAEYRLRRVSPQTLVRYRDNWSLDAWCHGRRGLRQFVLSRMRNVRVLDVVAKDVSREKLETHFADPYGIFAGSARGKAVLLFEGDAAHIVGEEQWHPKQKRTPLSGGRIRLEFPCGDVRELARDVMRFADEVTVEEPGSLREAVEKMVQGAAERVKR